jgi:hypothetical protein
MREENAVVIDVESQRKTVGQEGGGHRVVASHSPCNPSVILL